jgi:hypothetical protein
VDPAEQRPPRFGARDEAVHATAVDVVDRVDVVVRTAGVAVARVVERPLAPAAHRIVDADVLRDAVGAGEHAEVGVEGPVLLHDHDDVPDLVDAAVRPRRPGRDEREQRDRRRNSPHGRAGSRRSMSAG